MTETTQPESEARPVAYRRENHLGWFWDLLFIIILLAGAFFRFTGLNWDSFTHLHPDERFLTMVAADLQPVKSLSQFFDTAHSTLNPNNRGYGFYVYGDLPLFIVRYVGEWMHQTGYNEIHLVGREVSGLMDLLTVLMVYLIANRIYKKGILSVLAAGFAAFEVLPIQQSHFFTVDTFTNFFGFLAFYYAARLLPNFPLTTESRVRAALAAKGQVQSAGTADVEEGSASNPEAVTAPAQDDFSYFFGWTLKYWSTAIPYVIFGIGLGMAVASKLNAAALAALLPAAVFIRWLSLSKEERERWAVVYLRNLVIGAAVSLIVFRICQPYAFAGPGFITTKLNPQWVQNIQDQRAQAEGDVDFPPALQWARRTMVWFPFENLVVWGLGLPLGILAWAGFFWMAWRMIKGEWKQHLLVWGWTLLYFGWQASSWNPTMRYFLLVYPSLAIIAAWTVVALWEKGRGALRQSGAFLKRVNWWKAAGWAIGVGVMALTIAWAFAYLQIYIRPLTRVEASAWIYQNVPGPINVKIDTGKGVVNEPLAFRSGFDLLPQSPLVMAFKPRDTSQVVEVNLEHVGSSTGSVKSLTAVISATPDVSKSLGGGFAQDTFLPDNSDPRGKSYKITLNQPVPVEAGKTYYLILQNEGTSDSVSLAGSISVGLYTADGIAQQYLPDPVNALQAGQRYIVTMNLPAPQQHLSDQSPFAALLAPTYNPPAVSGTVSEVVLPHIVDWSGSPQSKIVRLSLVDVTTGDAVLASATLDNTFAAISDPRGNSYTFKLDKAVKVDADHNYAIWIDFLTGPGRLGIYGSKQANESSWDDALPMGIDGHNPYDYAMGIYRSDLNFEMYWDDNADKRDRFLSNLDQADYIFISSNRQWGTTVRVPERYPMTTLYYRDLLGCPADKEITWCYSVAEPGMFHGSLGFDLVEVVASEPSIDGLTFNSQFAEEAYSVYDHPKVMIFKKTAAYNPNQVRDLFYSVDLTKVIHLTPRKAGSFPGNLLLPPGRLAEEQAGGTWAALFHPDALFNQYPGVAAVLWYLVISMLGLVVYPFVRLALHGLPDRGYPFSRISGMLLLAYFVWIAGSYNIAFTPLTISVVFLILLVACLALALWQREAIIKELRERWRYYLLVEVVMLVFFLIFLGVRLGNPDLWHPYKGGEKPMDFSYFNAVLKSTNFPPYDPWFAGGYINYYYFGFVLVGVPVKWLGIEPSIAYNLILPTLYGILACGAFSIGWNLLESTRLRRVAAGVDENSPYQSLSCLFTAPFWGGISAAIVLQVIGNWGTVRMVWWGIQKLAPMNVPFEKASLPLHLVWTVQGFAKLLGGASLPYGPGDWYWIPSRVYPGEPITEFPAFTFLYADPHAHLIALPLTVLAIGFALAVLLGKWGWKGWGHLAATFFLGALTIGALWPTNTWDWPTYLALGSVAIAYTALRYGNACCLPLKVKPWGKHIILAVAGILVLAVLSYVLFLPYRQWYGQGYNSIDPWSGDHSPFWSYMTHWSVFLFMIASWMAYETIDWMATTPASALKKLDKVKMLIEALAVVLALAFLYLLFKGVSIALVAVPMAAWAGVLLLRPNMPDAKRFVLFMTGTALALTLFVELFVLKGDIGRMNTVFKFYLQAWTLFAISAGASLIWLIPAIERVWRSNWRVAWQVAAVVLVLGAATFPVMAGTDKIKDRMASQAPHTLDGMAFMQYSTYNQKSKDMQLDQDYQAIRWMQLNVEGSPVIVEANEGEYTWTSRFTIYTGLPGVVGWNWHQRQQRAITPDSWVWDRVNAIKDFYSTSDVNAAVAFLKEYNVKYIIVGQLEEASYPPPGLAKFAQNNGKLWQQVYHQGDTTIYQVK